MKDIDTWYVLADGTHGHPAEVEKGDDGVLKHKNGVHVALRENGLPLTSGVATKSNQKAASQGRTAKTDAKAADKPAADVTAQAKDMKTADQAGGYVTRETKAD